MFTESDIFSLSFISPNWSLRTKHYGIMNSSGLIYGELKTTTLRDTSTKEMKTLNESICILFCERMSNFPF